MTWHWMRLGTDPGAGTITEQSLAASPHIAKLVPVGRGLAVAKAARKALLASGRIEVETSMGRYLYIRENSLTDAERAQIAATQQ